MPNQTLKILKSLVAVPVYTYSEKSLIFLYIIGDLPARNYYNQECNYQNQIEERGIANAGSFYFVVYIWCNHRPDISRPDINGISLESAKFETWLSNILPSTFCLYTLCLVHFAYIHFAYITVWLRFILPTSQFAYNTFCLCHTLPRFHFAYIHFAYVTQERDFCLSCSRNIFYNT